MRHHDFLASEYAPAAPDAAAFHVIPAPLEQSTSYGGGTARGPAAILAASQQLEAWDGISAPCEGGVYTAPAVTCATSEEALSGIEQAVATALAHKALPVLLGGEHTVTLGALRALAREARRNGTPFGVVQIDAHADLRPSYEGNPLSHASVMYRAVTDLELPLAQFAMRDYCREEAAIRRRFQITAIDAAVLHDRGIPEQPLPAGFPSAPAVTCATSEEALSGIEQAVATALAHKALPVLLGGEHTVTLGALRALAREARRNGTPFGVVQIDAHADLRPSYEGNPLSHASVMYRAVTDLELPLAQFAMRDYCREEAAIRRRFQITAIDAAVLHDRGIPEQPLPAGFPSHIYITFDVDGLDASLMPATGTPSPGGLFWYDALRLIERCCRGRRVVGMDVVELAPLPCLHHADFTAAKLTHVLMGFAQRANAAPI